MENLNDRVEGVFRGVVLIALSFVASLMLLILRPLDGYVQLIARTRKTSERENQIHPYAFVFFAIALVFFVPSLMNSISPYGAGSLEYRDYSAGFSDAGLFGQAYQQIANMIESKAATAIFVSATVGVAALHLCGIGSGFALFRLPARRETWRDALFFIGGLQVMMFALATLLDRLGTVTETDLVKALLLSPRALAHGYGDERPYPIYLSVLAVGLLILLLLVPFGMATRFASRLSLWSSSIESRRRNWTRTIALMMLIDVAAIGSFSASAYVADEIQPREGQVNPFSVRNVSCTLDPKTSSPLISGTAILRVDAKDAWDFGANDFDLFIAADRTAADGPSRSRSRALSPTRIGAGGLLRTSFTAISPNIGQPPFLLQAGQAVLIRFEAEASPELVKFLSSHPDAQRCTISYNNDYPVGAIGLLRTED